MRAQDFPIEFRREIEALLGGEADEFFAACGRPHCRGLRLNARAGLSGAAASPMLALGGDADFGAAHELASGFIGAEVEWQSGAYRVKGDLMPAVADASAGALLHAGAVRNERGRGA